MLVPSLMVTLPSTDDDEDELEDELDEEEDELDELLEELEELDELDELLLELLEDEEEDELLLDDEELEEPEEDDEDELEDELDEEEDELEECPMQTWRRPVVQTISIAGSGLTAVADDDRFRGWCCHGRRRRPAHRQCASRSRPWWVRRTGHSQNGTG